MWKKFVEKALSNLIGHIFEYSFSFQKSKNSTVLINISKIKDIKNKNEKNNFLNTKMVY